MGGTTITKAELDHLISVEATIARKNAGVKVTKPVILEPPNYTNCVASELAAHRVQGEALHSKGKTSAAARQVQLAFETTTFRTPAAWNMTGSRKPILRN